jgi:hypothetical protein
MEEHNNQTVFKLSNHEKNARLRLWYLNEGFFSKLTVLEKTTSDFGIEIKQLFLDGYKA